MRILARLVMPRLVVPRPAGPLAASPDRGRARGRRRGRILALGAGVALAGVLASAAPASAVAPYRDRLPIVGGTSLEFDGGVCTAGGVFQSNSLLRTAYGAAVRYVLTAGHCGDVDETVSVAGSPVGVVVWESAVSDLLLVKVNPSTVRRQRCHSSSFSGVICSLVDVPEPRAASRALLPSLATRSIAEVPVRRWSTVGYADRPCTSGRSSEVICGWEKRPWSTVISGPQQPGEEAAESPTGLTASGDSGGPVVSADGTLHGVIGGVLGPGTGQRRLIPDLMYFTSIYQFMAETRNAYALAPS